MISNLTAIGIKLLDFSRNTSTLERVLMALAGAIHEASDFLEKLDEDEISYRGDEEFDVIETVLGTAFVACQGHMNGVISRVEQIQRRTQEASPSTTLIDGHRITLLSLSQLPAASVSQAMKLWHLANYFKHVDEWGVGWHNALPQSSATITAIKLMGLSAGSSGNVRAGATQLGLIAYSDLHVLLDIVNDWGDAVDDQVRRRLGLHTCGE